MYTVVAVGQNFSRDALAERKRYLEAGQVMFGNVPVRFCVVRLKRPDFNPSSARDRQFVLVKVTAFSCNYRDKGMLLFALQQRPRSLVPFGSEFCARVVDVGADVSGYSVGDRVMPDSSYPENPAEGASAGVATNFASQGWLRIHHSKLMIVPDSMDDATAACFTLGAQTAMGMIRRSGVLKGDARVAVLSARSSTSLFVTRLLVSLGVIPTCFTTSKWSEADKGLISPAPLVELQRGAVLDEAYDGRFTHVFDPFIDMNLRMGVHMLDYGGVYTTCGFLNQHPDLYCESVDVLGRDIQLGLQDVIVKLIRIQGNCLGSRTDLERAVRMYGVSNTPVNVQSQFTCNDVARFIYSSFFDSRKLGKAVMLLDRNDGA